MNHDPQTLSYQDVLCYHWAVHGGSPQAKQGAGKVRRCPHCRAQFGYDSKVQPQLLAQEGLSSRTFPSSLQEHSGFPSQTQLLLRLESAQMQDLGPSAFLSVYKAVKRYLSPFQSSSHPVWA